MLDAGGYSTLPSPGSGYACRLELDINTDGDFEGELPRQALPALWDELVRLGAEIAEKGDVP